MKVLKELSGHSGCNVILCKENTNLFVRKISSSYEYNSRLVIQCQKQKTFSSKLITSPKVFRSGYLDNLFYFDMEYIQGETLSQKLCNLKVMEIIDVVNKLLTSNTTAEYCEEKTKKTIVEKILNLKTIINCQNYDIYFSYLLAVPWNKLPISYCHGDLTLENIIIDKKGNLIFIDFLDSFINSRYIDISKLLQDLEAGWSYRNTQNIIDYELRIRIAKEVLIEKIMEEDNGFFKIKMSYILLLLNLLRIIPYTNDRKTMNFINNNLKKVYSKIIKEEFV